MSMWKSSLFGCFDDLGLCIITYLVPCYTFGKNAEAMGENCLCCGEYTCLQSTNTTCIFYPVISEANAGFHVRRAHIM